MKVAGGQETVNKGVDFAAQTGLQGVTQDPNEERWARKISE
jgi:hypothetical protein